MHKNISTSVCRQVALSPGRAYLRGFWWIMGILGYSKPHLHHESMVSTNMAPDGRQPAQPTCRACST